MTRMCSTACLCAIALLTGCGSTRVAQDASPVPPVGSQLVGAGSIMRFTAPQDGAVYLMQGDDPVLSRDLHEGEIFSAEGKVVVSKPAHIPLIVASLPVGGRKVTLGSSSRLYFLPDDANN